MWWILMIPFLASAALGTAYALTDTRTSARSAAIAVMLTGMIFGGSYWSYTLSHGMSQRGAVSGYQQYINTSAESTAVSTITCSRDGSCRHTYKCDSYDRWEKTGTKTEYYTSKGERKSRQKDVYGWVTHWHHCPFATKELTYTVRDVLGNRYTIASNIFEANAKEWRKGHGLPNKIARGVPAQWQHVRDSIQAGNAAPVTVKSSYSNFILASNSTILRSYSEDIKKLQKKNLLPAAYINPIYDHYKSKKLAWVGMRAPSNASTWEETLARLNAGLGMRKQGDMHLVVVRASALKGVIGANDYAQAVKAYWLNNLGKNAMAKNAILVVLGVDDSAHTVQWANATTGMPEGNGAMLNALKLRLNGSAFAPVSTIGEVRASIGSNRKATYSVNGGTIAQTVFNDFPFKRACMDCADKGDDGSGYVYLSSDIPISGWATFWATLINLIIAVALWGVLFRLRINAGHNQPHHRTSYPYNNYR